MNEFEFINKITNVKIGCGKAAIQEAMREQEGPIHAYRVIGRCEGFEIVPTDNGESNKYIGQFEGINAITGEVFRSKALYLPPLASDILEDQLLNTNEKDPTITEVERQTKAGKVRKGNIYTFKNQIEFGIDISATPAPTSATGYEWGAKPIIETKQEDPFKALKANIKPIKPPVKKLEAAKK